MANSRSNIYPVQLQGAELNLNKLDAEIKQYSGFNKNNSPFVGGCLSNIFTKDETIEGATSKNTYIAPNGDVYRVNTEGLWKNEEKLVDYTGKKFYKVEKCNLQYSDDVVYIDSEECYITNSFDGRVYSYVLQVYNVFTETWETVTLEIPDTSIMYNFDIKCCKNENTMLVFVCYNAKDGGFPTRLAVYKITEEGITRTNLTSIPVIRDDTPPTIHLEMTDNNTGILTIMNKHQGSQDTSIASCYLFDMTGVIIWDSYIDAGFISTASVDKIYNTSQSGGSSKIFSYDYKIQNKQLVLSNPLEGTGLGTFDIQSYILGRPVTFRNYGFCYAHLRFSSDNRCQYLGVCDFLTPAISVTHEGINNFVHINTGMIIGKYVLYNNGMPSGICLPSGNILVTEWNTVDEDYIFRQDYKKNYNGVYCPEDIDLIYKSNNTWYKLKESTPEIHVINDQIVCNVDYYNNSYCPDKKQVMLFAPAWNNRIPGNKGQIATGDFDTIENRMFIASSINEYRVDNNPSILINPVSVLNVSIDVSKYVYRARYKPLFVNYYLSALDSSECLYKCSQFITINDIKTHISFNKFVTELSDLPFPTNTDGNVQYSPSLFATEKGKYGNLVFISEGGTAYKLMTYDNKAVMSYFLSTAVEGLQDFFTIQGQLYGILDNQIYNFSIVNEIANRGDFIVSVEGLQFVGNTPYEALFFSKTNRCLYSFTGANVLNAKQFVDKISEVRNYKYNPATQSIFLITDIGVIVYSLFGIYQIEFLNCQDMYLLNNGVILTDNEGTFKYVKYYKEETTDDYTKENIQLETMFYGMNNQTVTINDCLYMRIFSEEHEEGDLEVSATTLSLEGRMTEKTTFKIKASDWDAITHTIYLRYQPKEQRGLGISFSINSPFKIASLSVGSQADAILVDKVSKGAINAPQRTSNNVEW